MERIREIPSTAVEVQTGLWADRKVISVGNITRVGHHLYSSEGYCFYLISDLANYDEDGNLLPENQRVYAQYMSSAYQTVEQINADVVSVPVQEGYEIVSVSNNHETV